MSDADAPVRPICNGDASCARTIFVTKEIWNGNFQTGLAPADTRCNTAAGKSSNSNVAGRKFVAWVSSGSGVYSATQRHVHGTMPYLRSDGLIVANNWDHLTRTNSSVDLTNAISVDEHGNPAPFGPPPQSTFVWTGTNVDGTSTTDTCNAWDTSTTGNGTVGEWHLKGPGWSSSTTKACAEVAHLYCIEK